MSHIIERQRYTISAMYKQGYSQKEIAEAIEKDKYFYPLQSDELDSAKTMFFYNILPCPRTYIVFCRISIFDIHTGQDTLGCIPFIPWGHSIGMIYVAAPPRLSTGTARYPLTIGMVYVAAPLGDMSYWVGMLPTTASV